MKGSECDDGEEDDEERNFVQCNLCTRYRRVGDPWDEDVEFTWAAEEVQQEERPCTCETPCDCDDECEQCCDCIDCESRAWVVTRKKRNLLCLCNDCKAERAAARTGKKRKRQI